MHRSAAQRPPLRLASCPQRGWPPSAPLRLRALQASSTATRSRFTASAFVLMPSTRPKAVSFAASPMAHHGAADRNQPSRSAGRHRAVPRSAANTKGRDRYRRIIAVCFKGTTNLNAWMVAQGWAVAFRKYGLDYVSEEDDARAEPSWASGKANSRCHGIGGPPTDESSRSSSKT